MKGLKGDNDNDRCIIIIFTFNICIMKFIYQLNSDPSNDDIEENESDDVFKYIFQCDFVLLITNCKFRECKKKHVIVGKAGSSKVAYHNDHPTRYVHFHYCYYMYYYYSTFIVVKNHPKQMNLTLARGILL